MATTTLPEVPVQERKKTTTKYVYFSAVARLMATARSKDDLGGKGAGLAEMTNAGLRPCRIHRAGPRPAGVHAGGGVSKRSTGSGGGIS